MTLFIRVRVLVDEQDTTLPPANPYGQELIFKRYPYLDPRDSYMDDIMGLPWAMDWIGVAIIILIPCLCGLWLGRRAPLALMPMKLAAAPRSSLADVRGLWRVALRASDPSTRGLMALGFVLGLTGAWVGELSASLLLHFRYEAAWARGMPQTAKYPTPLFSWFALSDGVWVLGGACLLTMASIVLPARRSLIRSGELARRFCLDCGYPRSAAPSPAAPHDDQGSPPDRCPEYGENFAVNLPRT
jgi:hypothetical protein